MIRYDIDVFMDPWAGLADDDEISAYYNSIGTLSDDQYLEIIKKDLLPYFNSFNTNIRRELLNKLLHALNMPNYNFEREFNSVLPPFPPPQDPRQFFIWIYEQISEREDA